MPRARSPRSVAWIAAVLAGGLLLEAADGQEAHPPLATPVPAVWIKPARLTELANYGCAKCHVDVTEEWASSAHGLAWVDEEFRAQAQAKKRPELCYGCHVPEPLLAGELDGRPDAREPSRDLGVHCESCHQDQGGAMLGP